MGEECSQNEKKAHVWVPTYFYMAGYIDHNPCPEFTTWRVVAAMPITVLLFCVPIRPRGHHLPLVRNQVKVTQEAHIWLPAMCQMVTRVFIDHNLWPEFTIWRLM
jgi:hypothetical protein